MSQKKGRQNLSISVSSSSTLSDDSEPSKQVTAWELVAAIPNPITDEDVGRVLFEGVSEAEFEAALDGIAELHKDCGEIRFIDLVGDQILIVDMASHLHEGVGATFGNL